MTVEFSSPIPNRSAPNGRENNLHGDRYGRLVLLAEVEGQGGKPCNRKWMCRCDCGTITASPMIRSLRTGATTSCGCVHKETVSKAMTGYSTKHGLHGTPAYRSWKAMKTRCTNENQHGYENYGFRGISICSRWEDFENFYSDMGHCPTGMSIERKDNNKGYNPENCIWATRKEQNRNQRSNRLVSYMGRNICVSEAAEIAGIRAGTVRARLNSYGWPISKALGPEFGDPLL